jgi:hypothetical protein
MTTTGSSCTELALSRLARVVVAGAAASAEATAAVPAAREVGS